MSSKESEQRPDQPAASLPNRQGIEPRALRSPLHVAEIPDLMLGQTGDAYEQQAERIASQMQAAPLAAQGSTASEGSLAPRLRAPLEQHLGADFSQLRIHSDAEAAASARMLNAAAYTRGSDVVFGAGRFQPQTPDGARLLAHEVVHVVQQAGNSRPMLQREALPGSQPIISPGLARMLGQLTLDNFVIDSATPTALHLAELDTHAATLRELLSAYPGGAIAIRGHADAPGTEQHNARLGQQRADAILAALVQRGIDQSIIQSASAGESQPRVAGSGAEGRNRCVIIEFHPVLPFAPSSTPLQLPPPTTPTARPELRLRPDFQLPTRPAYVPPTVPAAPAPNRPRVQLTLGGLVWLDIVVNPPGPVAPEARVGQLFREHGIALGDAELRALLDGRAEGIQQLERIIAATVPSMDAAMRGQLARSTADALMSSSLRSQLEREHPTAIEQAQRRERQFEDLMAPGSRGPSLEGGVRLRIHF